MWGPLIRVVHWVLVSVFLLNYFFLEAGSNFHQIGGYIALCAVLVRVVWGVFSTGYGSFSQVKLGVKDFAVHLLHLKQRDIPATTGHNPIGWLMIFFTWLFFTGLAVTGFMLEEIDYFFGNSLLEQIHSTIADVLYAFVLLHIVAVFAVAWWGKVSLLRPMITGKRKL